MGSTEQNIEEQFAQLQQKVGARHAEVLNHDADDDQFAVEYARLMNISSRLVEFEKTIPEQLAEPERQRSERIVTWSWRGQAAVGAVLIALVFVLDRSTWWVVLLVPHFVGTVAGCFQKVDVEQHRDRRFGAVALHVIALLMALISL
ncbi:hypothetical protein [Streptomyces sp. NBC_00102]|uniref:hypothetical protein n=1 Tax=Streptomyces sp. NBC_00102 TaxID=2975652 RepID=UPI00224EEB47|nr:hypothetical protein [Streptomyces sp. NBC_00102]MCX5401999.1 hypothetical protein [Streptomyces sp. NBC_00102]